MNLTPAQIATLRAAILANADPAFVALRNGGATSAMADWYNAAGTFVVWRSSTPADEIMDTIVWANFTPADTPDGTQAWANRSLACQGKQFNLQTMIVGRQSVASGRANVRAGLQDALTSLPSGPTGANRAAGWAAVQAVIQRLATLGEQLFASGTGTTATPGTLGAEGAMTDANIVLAVNN